MINISKINVQEKNNIVIISKLVKFWKITKTMKIMKIIMAIIIMTIIIITIIMTMTILIIIDKLIISMIFKIFHKNMEKIREIFWEFIKNTTEELWK